VVHFLVDSSGSMDRTAGSSSVRRIDAARDALKRTAAQLSPSDQVGVRVFGLSGSCSDGGVLAVPIGPRDIDSINAAADQLRPSGETPTPAAIQAAIQDFPAGKNRQLVIISDGESSCGDPCADVRTAVFNGLDVTMHTVGFSVSQEAELQLSCIAAATGGTYFPAPDAASLNSALNGATSTNSRVKAGRGTSLIQLLVNSYAHEDWPLVRALNPARRKMTDSQLSEGWRGMEEAWVYGLRERQVSAGVVQVDSIYVTHERVVPALAKKRGLAVGAPITQAFCITWRVDTRRREVQEKSPKWFEIYDGYVNPDDVATRRSC
jgi:von Willebrand factor type A domain